MKALQFAAQEKLITFVSHWKERENRGKENHEWKEKRVLMNENQESHANGKM